MNRSASLKIVPLVVSLLGALLFASGCKTRPPPEVVCPKSTGDSIDYCTLAEAPLIIEARVVAWASANTRVMDLDGFPDTVMTPVRLEIVNIIKSKLSETPFGPQDVLFLGCIGADGSSIQGPLATEPGNSEGIFFITVAEPYHVVLGQGFFHRDGELFRNPGVGSEGVTKAELLERIRCGDAGTYHPPEDAGTSDAETADPPEDAGTSDAETTDPPEDAGTDDAGPSDAGTTDPPAVDCPESAGAPIDYCKLAEAPLVLEARVVAWDSANTCVRDLDGFPDTVMTPVRLEIMKIIENRLSEPPSGPQDVLLVGCIDEDGTSIQGPLATESEGIFFITVAHSAGPGQAQPYLVVVPQGFFRRDEELFKNAGVASEGITQAELLERMRCDDL